jgi:hypothetical protein
MNDESEMMHKETVLASFKALLSPGGIEENHGNYSKLETENRTSGMRTVTSDKTTTLDHFKISYQLVKLRDLLLEDDNELCIQRTRAGRCWFKAL